MSATGSPNLIGRGYIKRGAVVIDAGAAELGGRIVGDVDIETIGDLISWISPSTGGVGPVTISMLIENLIIAYKLQQQ